MSRVRLRPQAELDILEIWTYIAEDNFAAADRWVDALNDSFALWATQPALGRPRDEVDAGLRRLACGRYVVFYETLADGIDVIRVLHGSRDVDQAFNR